MSKHLLRSAALAVGLLVASPAAALAGPTGSLQQVPSPGDCVTTASGTGCGTVIQGGTTDARSVRVSPDGNNAYVASGNGAITTFRRNERTGALSFQRCLKDRGSTEVCQANVSPNPALEGILSAPKSVDVSPDGKNVYVASSFGTAPFSVDAVTAFARDQSTGALRPLGGKDLCISETLGGAANDADTCRQGFGLSGVTRIRVSRDGTRIYAVSPTDSTLAVLIRDPDTGALTQTVANCFRGTNSSDQSCTGNGDAAVQGLNNPNAVAVSPDSDNVYAVSRERSTLAVLRTATTNGGLTSVECQRGTTSQDACVSAPTQGLNAPNAVEVSPDGNDVYTASTSGTGAGTGNTVTEFNRSGTGGGVAFSRCIRDRDAVAEATPPNGAGGCTQVARGIRGATQIAVKDNGTSVYVSAAFRSNTAAATNDIAQFSRETDNGNLEPLAGTDQCIADQGTECPENNMADGLTNPVDLDVTPDGLFVYAAAAADDAVSAFSIQVPPVCQDVTQPASPNNQPVTIPLRCADPNGDPFTLSVVNPPDSSNGTVTINQANDTATFTPATGFSGTETFTYRAEDSRDSFSNIAQVRVTISPPGAPVITIDDASADEGDAGTKNLTFTLRLSDALASPTSVSYDTENGTAVAPGDYTGESGTVTFPAFQTTATITVAIKGDETREADERFAINLSDPTNGAVIGDSRAVGTIDNDDQSVLNVNDPTVSEAAGAATFTVELTNPSDSTIQATYNTEDDTASAPGDYTARKSLKVSFAPGDTSQTITVPLNDDEATERTERFSLVLSAPTGGATLGKATGVATITNDDPPRVRISDTRVTEGNEGTTPATFTVSLSAAVSNDVSVKYATERATAAAPGDYTAETGTVMFEAGETSKTVAIAVKGDTVLEDDETFRVRLSEPNRAVLGADPVGTGTIDNDDQSRVDVNDVTVSEAGPNATFTVRLSNPSESDVEVTYSTQDDTAKAAGDYTARTNQKVTFAPGETSKPVSIPVTNDTTPEQTERFSVKLSAPTGGATLGKATGVATITDNDLPAVSVSNATAGEGNDGPQTATFTVSLSAAVSNPVTVDFATADETARQPGDYRATSGKLTFAPGETSKTVTVPVVGDTEPEADETFRVVLSNPSGATLGIASGVGTIVNDDQAPPPPAQPTLSVSDVSVAEGNTGTRDAPFTVSLSAPQSSPVTVRFATADDTARAASDYRAATGTLTFAPGEVSKPVPVPVNGDLTIEPDERFRLVVAEPAGATIGKAAGVATITNDDAEIERVAPRGISVKVTPRRDRSKPFRFTTRGRLLLPAGLSKSDGCEGRVSIQIKRGRKTISTRRKTVSSSCRFKSRVTFNDKTRFPRTGKLKVTVRFLGNDALKPAKAKARKVRFSS